MEAVAVAELSAAATPSLSLRGGVHPLHHESGASVARPRMFFSFGFVDSRSGALTLLFDDDSSSRATPSSTGGPRIASLRDIASGGGGGGRGPAPAPHNHSDGDDSDDDDTAGENWFAGGERRYVALIL